MRDDLFQRAFDYFDGPAFGGGQGSFKLDIVEKGSEQIPIITATDFPPAPPAEEAAEGGAEPVEEARDAVGAVWHKLINSSFVESLSARCSGLSRYCCLVVVSCHTPDRSCRPGRTECARVATTFSDEHNGEGA